MARDNMCTMLTDSINARMIQRIEPVTLAANEDVYKEKEPPTLMAMAH